MLKYLGVIVVTAVVVALLLTTVASDPAGDGAERRHLELLKQESLTFEELETVNTHLERIVSLLERRGSTGSALEAANVSTEPQEAEEDSPESTKVPSEGDVGQGPVTDVADQPTAETPLPQTGIEESGRDAQKTEDPDPLKKQVFPEVIRLPESSVRSASELPPDSTAVPEEQVDPVPQAEQVKAEDDGPVYMLELNGSFGAAVAIADGKLVTVRHIGSGRGRVRIQKQWYWCNIAPARDGRDIAVVSIAGAGAPKLRAVRVGSPRFGQRIKLYSFNEQREFDGSVVSSDNRSGELALVPDAKGVFPGDSGSGVFDESGNLLGIVNGYINREHRHVQYTPIQGLNAPFESAEAPAASGGKPKIWITQADFACMPCEALKRSVAAGDFASFEIEYLQPRDGIERFPAIEFTDATGVRRVTYGFNGATASYLKQQAK